MSSLTAGSLGIPIETFPALDAIDFCRHGFTGRVSGLSLEDDRATALTRLSDYHDLARRSLGRADWRWATAEQVHGNTVAIARATNPAAGADGLITNERGLGLGIYVADCCAVYLIDPNRRCVGLVHSGKRGTELNIVGAAIEALSCAYGSVPSDLVVQLSPCIRPPRYEVDFAQIIIEQCRVAGVREVNDCGICTAAHPDRYYSYRAERGRTGRMLALLALT